MSGNLPPGYQPDASFPQHPFYSNPNNINTTNGTGNDVFVNNNNGTNGNNTNGGFNNNNIDHASFPAQDPYYQQAYPYPPPPVVEGFAPHPQQVYNYSSTSLPSTTSTTAPSSSSFYPPQQHQQHHHHAVASHPVYTQLPHQPNQPHLLDASSSHPYAAAYASASTSPQLYAVPPHPADASPVPWQQQQQQQQLQQQQHLSSTPAALPGHASTVSPSPAPPEDAPAEPRVQKITLRVPKPKPRLPTESESEADADGDGDADNMSSRRAGSSRGAAAPTGRPLRTRGAVNYNVDDDEEEFADTPTPPPAPAPVRRGGRATRGTRVLDDEDEGYEPEKPVAASSTRRSSRAHMAEPQYVQADDFEGKMMESSPVRPQPPKRKGRYIADPDDDEDGDYQDAPPNGDAEPEPETEEERPRRGRRAQPRPTRHSSADAESFAPSESDGGSPSASSSPEAPGDEYVDDMEDFIENDDSPRRPARRATRAATITRRSTRNSRRANDSDSDDEVGKTRNLRKRNAVNYALPPMDLTAELAAAEHVAAATTAAGAGPRGGRGAGGFGFGRPPKYPWMVQPNTNTANRQAMGDPDSSDSDDNLQMAGPSRGGPAGPAGPAGPNVPGPTDVKDFGRFNPKTSNADVDPLGVDVNVTFDRVGGLDHHINQLKEMVALPLLYPELFKQFGIIPPRGVLFHGPPGTGKTLLARALAASSSTGNTKISFFMRKGADVLSKWVGEAERQLRMLFEEARASQPSIIFFDEIDGLAPVRSSKQDQIHASLVSTLLALMDGMDGRGQVIVIGATNRPDAVDPALRRPGRFDREFYFPLPNLDARRQIIQINTRAWEPQLPDEMLSTLASLTKGYGGADLRSLCTEAALNAIQRKYPQIYKTTDRLQVQPGSIHVQPKDFMLAVKKIIPSSARSAASSAIQLPLQLVPLLVKELERIKEGVDRVLPPVKQRTALEEAEYEDEDGDTFEKEIMLQSLDKLRTYRPRLLVYGPQGSGQTYLGPALLHHLEGFHVQTFDLATLMSDSTRTTEAAIVQLFVEAKRHQPSVIFIPSLAQWSSTVSEIARATTRALLDGIPPSDPVLLLGIVDGPLASLPTDVRAWFGFDTDSRIELGTPERSQRVEFFAELLASVERKPTDFPDGVPRKRRVLEVLPLAEPLPPRQPTQAEIDREIERDNAARAMITLSFTSLLSDFARKFRRPVAMAKEAAMAYAVYMAEQAAAPAATITAVDAEVDAVLPAITIEAAANGEGAGTALMEVSGEEPIAQLAIVPPTAAAFPDSQMSDIVVETFVSTEPRLVPAAAVPPPEPITAEGSVQPEAAPNATSGADADAAPAIEAHNVDIDYMQQKLVKHKYYTPVDFLADIALIEANSKFMTGPEQLKVFDMCAQAQLHVQTFDAKWNPEFERYAQRMRARKAERKAKRDKEKAEAEAKEKEREEKERQEREQQQANGEAGAEATDAADSADTPNGLKRTREDGEPVEGEPAEKRAREDAMDVDPIESVQPATQQSTAESIQSFPTQPKGATPAVHESTPVPAKEPTPPPRTPTPPPVYPPLQVPGPQLAELSAILADDTGALTVDELEQLRAMLLDCVWRHRTSWDRASLVAEMGRRAALFIAEAGKMRELERLEREREQSHAYGF